MGSQGDGVAEIYLGHSFQPLVVFSSASAPYGLFNFCRSFIQLNQMCSNPLWQLYLGHE